MNRSSSTSLSVHTNASGFLALAIFSFFFFLFSDSLSTVCLYTEGKVNARAPSLLRRLEAWNMNYSVLSHFQWIRVDANILETMPRKTEEKKIILVCVDKV